MKLYTTQDAADLLTKAPQTVRYLAAAHDIGTKVGRDWVFTEADIEALDALPGPGRPVGSSKKAVVPGEANDAPHAGDGQGVSCHAS